MKGAVWTVDEVEFYRRRHQRHNEGNKSVQTSGNFGRKRDMAINNQCFSNNEATLNHSYDESFNQSLQNALFNLSKTGQKEMLLSSHFTDHSR